MPYYFPPTPVYPSDYDSDETLFVVYNTSETVTTAENLPWSDEISIKPVAADKDEIWATNGFANIDGELFYYGNVELDGNDKVNKFIQCSRNLGGTHTKRTLAGTEVRGFVIAEHHNQIVDTIVKLENFIGYNFTPDKESLDWRIRNLQNLDIIFDDFSCPDVVFDFFILEDNPTTGILAQYLVTITGIFTNYRLDFGDGIYTTTSTNGTHRYAPNATIDPVLTISNNKCTIVQTPIERNVVTEPPPQKTTNTLEIPIPALPNIPQIIIPSVTVPSLVPQLPPIVFPCLNVGPIGPINIPSVISVIPAINIPSLVSITPVSLPSNITITSPSLTPISIPSQITITPVSIPNQITITPIPNIPTSIGFNPFPTPPKVGFTPFPTPPPISFNPFPSFPTTITVTPLTFPTTITVTPPNIPTTITVTPPNIPTNINFGPFPSVPNIPFGPFPSPLPKVGFSTPPSLPDVNFGPAPSFGPIQFVGAPTFPAAIPFINAPNIPAVIVITPVSIPNTINFAPAPTFPKISFAPPPTFPKIQFAPAPKIPAQITFGPAPNFPAQILFGPNPLPSIISFATAPKLGPIAFGPHNLPTEIKFGTPPTISVTWGTPPTVSCVVTVQCPSTTPFYKPQSLFDEETSYSPVEPLEVQMSDLGIPSEILVKVPEIPDIKLLHDIPNVIRVESPNIPDIKILGPDIPLPSSIKIDASGLPSAIELIAISLPSAIRLDTTGLPSTIGLDIPKELPTIKLDTSGIPDKIQVVGIPSAIELIGAPSEIKLVLPEKPEIELVYKGAPIDVKINLDISKLTGENEKAACVAIVPCNNS